MVVLLMAVVLVDLDFVALVVVMVVVVVVETAVRFEPGLLLLFLRSCRGGRGVKGRRLCVMELSIFLPHAAFLKTAFLLRCCRAVGVVMNEVVSGDRTAQPRRLSRVRPLAFFFWSLRSFFRLCFLSTAHSSFHPKDTRRACLDLSKEEALAPM